MIDGDYKKVHGRIIFVVLILSFFFVLFSARAFSIQVVEGERHAKEAERLTLGSDLIMPRRGRILDRQERVLVNTKDMPSLIVRPATMSAQERALAKKIVRQRFNLPSHIIDRIDKTHRNFEYIKRRVSDEKYEAFNIALQNAVKGLPKRSRLEELQWLKESKRSYQAGSLAAPVLGITDIDMRGRMGVESYYNENLKGKPFAVKGIRLPFGDRLAMVDFGEIAKAPMGSDIYLTLDRAAQFVAERVIRETVEKYKARMGVAITMDPNTGRILAMAQAPSFNPNKIRREAVAHMHNYAIEESIEPGSTVKPLVVAAALEEGVTKVDEMIECGNGVYRIGRAAIHDTHPYEELSVADVVIKSSNIGVAVIAERLGRERVYNAYRAFGFGVKTGIDLPFESKGLLHKAEDWNQFELATHAFGQGFNVTPLQLAVALGAIANGGKLVMPQIVERIETADGEVTKRFKTRTVRRVLTTQMAEKMRSIMAGVVQEGGTGGAAAIEACQVAGKTGTSEKLWKNHTTGTRDYWTSSFIGFLPADNPKLLVLVVVDEPQGAHYGGVVAAPAFRKIAEELVVMYGVCSMKANETLGEEK